MAEDYTIKVDGTGSTEPVVDIGQLDDSRVVFMATENARYSANQAPTKRIPVMWFQASSDIRRLGVIEDDGSLTWYELENWCKEHNVDINHFPNPATSSVDLYFAFQPTYHPRTLLRKFPIGGLVMRPNVPLAVGGYWIELHPSEQAATFTAEPELFENPTFYGAVIGQLGKTGASNYELRWMDSGTYEPAVDMSETQFDQYRETIWLRRWIDFYDYASSLYGTLRPCFNGSGGAVVLIGANDSYSPTGYYRYCANPLSVGTVGEFKSAAHAAYLQYVRESTAPITAADLRDVCDNMGCYSYGAERALDDLQRTETAPGIPSRQGIYYDVDGGLAAFSSGKISPWGSELGVDNEMVVPIEETFTASGSSTYLSGCTGASTAYGGSDTFKKFVGLAETADSAPAGWRIRAYIPQGKQLSNPTLHLSAVIRFAGHNYDTSNTDTDLILPSGEAIAATSCEAVDDEFGNALGCYRVTWDVSAEAVIEDWNDASKLRSCSKEVYIKKRVLFINWDNRTIDHNRPATRQPFKPLSEDSRVYVPPLTIETITL